MVSHQGWSWFYRQDLPWSRLEILNLTRKGLLPFPTKAFIETLAMSFNSFQQCYEIPIDLCEGLDQQWAVLKTSFMMIVIVHLLAFLKAVQGWLFSHTCLPLTSRICCAVCPDGFLGVWVRWGNKIFCKTKCGLLGLSPAVLPVGSRKKNTKNIMLWIVSKNSFGSVTNNSDFSFVNYYCQRHCICWYF